MISAPSLRQQLNGNKRRLILLLLVAVIFSCTISRNVSGYIPGAVVNDGNIPAKQNKDSVISKPGFKPVDTLDQVYPERKKNKYSIAYLLPFNLDNIDDPDEKQPSHITKATVDFYMGSTIALDKKYGFLPGKSAYDIRIFDTEGDENFIRNNILKELDKFRPDLIIGPFMPAEVKIISDYSLKNKIPLVCPVANINECLESNPYIIVEKPSLYSIVNSFCNFVKANYPTYRIILFGATKKDIDTDILLLRQNNDTSFLNKIHTVIVNENNWNDAQYDQYLSSGNNFFFIPVLDEFVVNSIISKLMTSNKSEDLLSCLHINGLSSIPPTSHSCFPCMLFFIAIITSITRIVQISHLFFHTGKNTVPSRQNIHYSDSERH